MARVKVSFDKQIEQALKDYADGVDTAMKAAIKAVAKEGLTKLKTVEPPKKRKGNAYKKGWRSKIEEGRLKTDAVLYGSKPETYAVAHLLENGHAKRGGGRVGAIEHIAPIQEWVSDAVVKKIEAAL